MKYMAASYLPTNKHNDAEERMNNEKRRQGGISFPAPRKQEYVLIVRINVKTPRDPENVKDGLKKLCTLFEQIDERSLMIEDNSSEKGNLDFYSLSQYNFTVTVGFGYTFFRKLDLLNKCPMKLHEMPNASELGDNCPYVLPQTDIILQIASNDYAVNRMVLQNDNYFIPYTNYTSRNDDHSHYLEIGPLDIIEAIDGWAEIADVHTGFHRADGRNLMGFYDGISNPYRLDNNDIWITREEGGHELADGTYMVFQKIEHDLKDWHKLDVEEQENWVGRSKATGLLLGTLSKNEEKRLMTDLHSSDSSISKKARLRLSELVQNQRNPRKNLFNQYDVRCMDIYKNCPVSSHARKANPRGTSPINQNFIFRRGFLYMDEGFSGYPKSGVLFISFQNDIKRFEDIKRKLSEVNGPRRTEKPTETNSNYHKKRPVQSTFDILTLGGGYYFVPPIPNKRISSVGQSFF